MRPVKRSLRTKFFLFVTAIFVLLGTITIAISIRSFRAHFKEDIKRFREDAYETEREELKSAVEIAIKTVNSFYSHTLKEMLEKEVKKRLKYYMDILINILNNYYESNKGKMPEEELKKKIIEIVKNAKYGKDGYFWINDLHPRMIMHPYESKLNGKDLSNYTDPTGKRVFVEMVKKVEKYGSGYVEYLWPKPGSTKPQLKLSYVVLFKPFNWVIGTGAYLKDYYNEVTKIAKQQALETLKEMRYGRNDIGYFWVMDDSGKILMHPIMPQLVGKVPAPAKLILKTLKNKKATFVIYKWPKPGGKTPKLKLAYVARFAPWHWIIGSGTYIEDIQEKIHLMEEKALDQIHALILEIVLGIGGLFLLVMLVMYRVGENSIFKRLEYLSERLKALAKGRFEFVDTPPSDDEIGKIEKSVNEIVYSLERLSEEIEKGFNALREGEKIELNLEEFSGDYRKILAQIEKFYKEVQRAVEEIRKFSYYLEVGYFRELRIEKKGLPPVFERIIVQLEGTREKILHTMEFLKHTVTNIKEGKFEIEPPEIEFSGVYYEIVEYLKEAVENFRGILERFERVSFEVAKGNFDVEIKEEEFRGGYRKIINYLKEIIEQLRSQLEKIQSLLNQEKELAEFRILVEGDSTIEESYKRIENLLKNRFKIEEFGFYEIDTNENTMKVILAEGNEKRLCAPQVYTNSNLCRARRTGHVIIGRGYSWGSTCEWFLYPENKGYICVPLLLGESIAYVLQIVVENKEEVDEYLEKLEEVKKYLTTVLPILEVKKLLKTLREKSLRDSLTGLYNRHFLEEYIQKAAALAKRSQRNIGIFMIDIDFFKMVNDEYGHDAGDKVLEQIAKILSNKFRKSDVVVRFGGEEFLVLLHDVDEDKLIAIAEDLRKTVENTPIEIPDGVIKKTISIGISIFPEDSDDIWEVIKFADVALYYAKRTGRNKVVRFKPEMLKEN